MTNHDVRDWQPDLDSRVDKTSLWYELKFSIKMSEFGKVSSGNYEIYLKINDPKETIINKRCIQFGIYDIWNTSLGASLIGVIIVFP